MSTIQLENSVNRGAPIKLNSLDERILEFVDESKRVTTQMLARELDASPRRISSRLNRMWGKGYFAQPGYDLWELVDDPRGQHKKKAHTNPRSIPEERVNKCLRRDLPGGGESLDRKVEIIKCIRTHLRKVGKASEDELRQVIDIKKLCFDDKRLAWKHLVEYNDEDALTSFPDIQSPPEGGSIWKYDCENAIRIE